jgi:hypothetical protein
MRSAVFLCALLATATASAHGFRPVRVDLAERDGAVRARVISSAQRAAPDLQLPDACAVSRPWTESLDGQDRVREATFRCASGLSGARVAVRGLAGDTDALLRWSAGRGAAVTLAVRAEAPEVTLPLRPNDAAAALRSYVPLGFEHILTGWDHLLFVLGLLLLTRRAREESPTRRLLGTITSFTLGHSVTLALAATGALRLRAAPVEAVIALSIVLLAWEVSRPEDAPRTLTERRPWAIALGFGLLHGLGFAGALAEVGVPDVERTAALAGFNVGVELGQLTFVLAALLGVSLLSRAGARALRGGLLVTRTAMGALGAFWTLERLGRIV